MEIKYMTKERDFVQTYFKDYGDRNTIIKTHFTDDFIGLDGISSNIYDKKKWLEAIDQDFNQVKDKFEIRITDYDARDLGNNLTIISTVSFWNLNLFEEFPEFDKMRTVFILESLENSIKIKHLSNSISLLSLNRDEIYPFTLTKFLKSWKKSLFGLGKMHQIDSEE